MGPCDVSLWTVRGDDVVSACGTTTAAASDAGSGSSRQSCRTESAEALSTSSHSADDYAYMLGPENDADSNIHSVPLVRGDGDIPMLDLGFLNLDEEY